MGERQMNQQGNRLLECRLDQSGFFKFRYIAVMLNLKQWKLYALLILRVILMSELARECKKLSFYLFPHDFEQLTSMFQSGRMRLGAAI